jgi:NAD-dependent dihydropyrimidine dehydrogenase PreA subunit
MPFVITVACVDVKDRSCMQDCPVDCIYEGNRMTCINPDECIDCGACEPNCPEEAIYFEPHVPEPLRRYVAVNREFFGGIGSPGGSFTVDLSDRDHPVVAALPMTQEG